MKKHLRAVTSASENLLKHAKSLQHYACDEKLDITLTISEDMKITQTKKLKLDLGELLTYLHKNLPINSKLDLSDGVIDLYSQQGGGALGVPDCTIRYNVKIDHTPIPTVTWIEVGEKFHEALEEIFHS